ncbi:ABC transporter substrate-binding protein [Streptomyces hygroscopicus]|uniref:ABC transporter substrate-binding protein n=1 Tax=Streptomyces hygroscopicus TaxID=1912 RepID=UPI0036379BBB
MTPTLLSRRTACGLLGGALTGSLLLTGCATTAGSGTGDPDTLTMATLSPPNVLDVAHGFTSPCTLVQFAILESPVTRDKNGKVIPQLAESWTEPNPVTYVFKLRKGVVFSDGSPMTAEDVAFSLSRHTDPKVASEAASMVSAVKSVRATGPDEVTVVLKSPTQTFLPNVAVMWQVVPKKLAAAHPQDLGTPAVGTLGTGPYKLTEFSSTEGVTLKRNEKYWGPKPAIGTVKVTTITDPETLRLAVSSGEVDGTNQVPPRDARKWAPLKDVKTRFYAGNSIAFLALNVKYAQLSDVHVRRAIAHAVNQEAMQRLLVGDKATPATTILTHPMLKALYGDGFQSVIDQLPQYPYDLAAARAELAKSKYPDGFELPANYNSGNNTADALQALAADLAKIGIKLKPNPLPEDAYRAKRIRHDGLTLGLSDLAYATPDPGELLPDLVSSVGAKPYGFNFAQLWTPQLDAQVNKVLGLKSGEERKQAVTEILTETAEQASYIPLYSVDSAIALHKRFTENVGVWTLNVFTEIKPAGA